MPVAIDGRRRGPGASVPTGDIRVPAGAGTPMLLYGGKRARKAGGSSRWHACAGRAERVDLATAVRWTAPGVHAVSLSNLID